MFLPIMIPASTSSLNLPPIITHGQDSPLHMAQSGSPAPRVVTECIPPTSGSVTPTMTHKAPPSPSSSHPSNSTNMPSPSASPNTHASSHSNTLHPQPVRKSSFIHKLRESAKEVVSHATGSSRHRSNSPAAHGNGLIYTPSTRSNSPTSTPPTSPGLSPSNLGGSDSYLANNNVTSHGTLQPLGASPIAPSHGDASPFPTIERKASFREIMAKTLSFGRSKSNNAHPPSENPHSSHQPTNSLLNKYGVCDKGCIGKGATAVVRLVHKLQKDGNEERVFAVKEFRKRRKNETERDYIKKLTSEFCISSSLHHINVVETIDLVQDEQEHWCEVMEYCAGGDLYSVIKNGKMTKAEINCCFKQLIHGVAYLHTNGVAHRDIKPENLLLDTDGHLKITDFGVSEVFKMCWESEPHLSKGICGSEPYIAPEEFLGGEYDAREVDVWACGIVYYAMMYGGIPWRHATKDDPNYAYYLAQRRRNFEALDRLPPDCRELMYRILEPDPSRRATISDILMNPWFQSIEVCYECSELDPFRNQSNILSNGGTTTGQASSRSNSRSKHTHHINVPTPRSRSSSNAHQVPAKPSASNAVSSNGAVPPKPSSRVHATGRTSPTTESNLPHPPPISPFPREIGKSYLETGEVDASPSTDTCQLTCPTRPSPPSSQGVRSPSTSPQTSRPVSPVHHHPHPKASMARIEAAMKDLLHIH